MKKHTIVYGGLLLVFIVSVGLAQKRSMTAEDTVAIKTVTEPQISPDGKKIAYVVREVDRKANDYVSHIWVVATEEGEPQRFTTSLKSDRFPRWSPDGKWMAFLSDRESKRKARGRAAEDRDREGDDREGRAKMQIWLMLVSGGEAWPLTDIKGGVTAFEWAPDGKKIAFLSTEPRSEEEETRIKDKFDMVVVDKDIKMSQLWLVDVGSQQTVQLTKDRYNVSDPQWSPDGRWIAFVTRPTPKADDAQFSDIMILSAEGGTPRKLVENEGPDTSPRWSPDGQWIAYVSSPRPFYGNQNDVYVVPASGGTPRSLTAALDRNETNPIWSPDGKTIYFEATTGVNHYFFSLPVSQGAIKPLINGNRVCSAVQLAKDGGFFALMLSDPMHPADVWVCRADGSGLRQLTRANPQLDDLKLGATETVRWRSPAGGWEIEGLLVKPADYQPGKKYPLIVEPHGGPAGVVTNSFRSMWQVLAGRGYAVLAPNFRGSDGYGKKFIEANVGDWGGGDYQDVMSGVDALIAKGIADPARLGVEGWSYGGFMTSWIVTHTNRFKAAVDGAGVTDLLSMYGTTDIQRFNEYYMLGRPWEKFEVYQKNSPMTYIAHAKTPTLILHGIEDRRVPISQGEEFYIGLKKVGVEAEFVRYPREPHGFTEPNHQIDRIQRTVAWFDKYLKPNGE